MTWQRARTEEQKLARRKSILDATASLLASSPLGSLSFNRIAKQCGLSKSNLYRYFGSREEVLLELLSEDIQRLTEDVHTQIGGMPEDLTAEGLSTVLVELLLAHERLAALLAQLEAVIEPNVERSLLLAFKLSLLDALTQIAADLEAKWPALLPSGAGVEVLQFLVVLLAGLWPQRDRPPALSEVLEHPALAPVRLDFRPTLIRGLSLVIRGL